MPHVLFFNDTATTEIYTLSLHDALPISKSLLKISKAVLTAKNSSSIYRFLSHSKWDDSLIDKNRISYLNLHFDKIIKPKSVGFLAIDDTVNPKIQAKKMQGLSYNFSHVSEIGRAHV